MRFFDAHNAFWGAMLMTPVVGIEIMDNPHINGTEVAIALAFCAGIGVIIGILTPPCRWLRAAYQRRFRRFRRGRAINHPDGN